MPEKKRDRYRERAQSTATVFADYARYYDLLYSDKDYAAEAEYIARLVKKYRPTARSILELGSGTGIHASLLAKKGFKVHGIERSPEMLTRSQILTENLVTEPNRLIFSQGDICEIRLNKHFDAVIAIFHVMSYQTTNEDVTAAFETARQHLKTGGIFIFDVWYGPAVLTDRPEVRVKRMSDDQTEVIRLAEPVLHPNENRVDVRYHVFVRDRVDHGVIELNETHSIRYFFKPEIDRFAFHAGFECLHSEEWLSGKPIGWDSWGACFLLRTF